MTGLRGILGRMSNHINPGMPDELLAVMDNPKREQRVTLRELAADVPKALDTIADGDRILVTADGKVKGVLVAVEYYDALIAALALQVAFREIEHGVKFIPHEEVMESLRRLRESLQDYVGRALSPSREAG